MDSRTFAFPTAALIALFAALGALTPTAAALDGVTVSGWQGRMDTGAQAGCPDESLQNDEDDAVITSGATTFDFSPASNATGSCSLESTPTEGDTFGITTNGGGRMHGSITDGGASIRIAGAATSSSSYSQTTTAEIGGGQGIAQAGPLVEIEVTGAVPYRISLTAASTKSGTTGNAEGAATLERSFPTASIVAQAIEQTNFSNGVPTIPSSAAEGTLEPGRYTFWLWSSCIEESHQFAHQSCTASATAELVLGQEDKDGDGLLDEWESEGIDFTDNGSIDLDLPAMAADPNRKDIFVEMDYMPPHRLEQAAIDAVAAAFAAAPVSNPDGSSGITLHVDNGPDSVMNPRTGQTWGSLSDQDVLPHEDVLGSENATDNYNWGAFDLIKAGNFSVDREPAFHYAPSIHQYANARTQNDSSGLSRGIGASDFFVSLGRVLPTGDQTFDVAFQAGTFMHELGHNLNLRHGGGDHEGWKPNYLSVMNYSFQMEWLATTAPSRVLDYSRYAFDLDETSLNEQLGLNLGGTPLASFVTTYYCPDGTAKSVAVVGSVDWDCDDTLAPGVVASNVNQENGQTTLTGHLDWPALVYDGGLVGAGAATLPATTTADEPSIAELEEAAGAMDAYVTPADEEQPPPADEDQPPPAETPSATSEPTEAGSPAARLTALGLRPRRFAAGHGRGASIALKRGTRATYKLSTEAAVRFTVKRRTRGGFRAVKGSFGHRGEAGRNRFRFTGRLRGRPLGPGRYRLVAKTKSGSRRRVTFTIR